MNGKSVTQHIRRLQSFYQQLNPYVDYYVPPHRFACLDRIGQQISAKKGAYTHAELLNWLSVMHTCLFAPSSYFPNERITFKSKDAALYEQQLLKFQRTVQRMQKENGTLGAYLQEIRRTKRNLSNMKNLPCYAQFPEHTDLLMSKFKTALEKRIKKAPTLQWNEHYDEAMIRIKGHIETALSAPYAWSFLPYCIFMELAAAEGLSAPNPKAEKDPLSLPQCTNEENIPTWFIRFSPFRELNSRDIEQLHSLQKCVQKALTKTIKHFELTSIGKEASEALLDWTRIHPYPLQSCAQTDLSDKAESASHFYHFYLPLWDQLSWSKLIFKKFKGTFCRSDTTTLTLTEIHAELNRLFRQTISARRIAKKIKPSKSANSNHATNYDDFSIVYQGKTFTLSSIMLALCTIFDPNQFFTVHPFQQSKLQQAIQLLTDFWSCIDLEAPDNRIAANYPVSSSVSQEEIMYRTKWLMLISYSNDCQDEDPQDLWHDLFQLYKPSTDFFISPSDELIHAVIAKARSFSVKAQKQNIHLQNEYLLNEASRGNRVAITLNEGICHALLSEKDLIDDIVAFTGIRALPPANSEVYTPEKPNLYQLISIWQDRVASPEEKQRVAALKDHLGKKPGLSQQIYTGLLKSDFQTDLDLDLSQSLLSGDVYGQVTKKLKKQKKHLFSFFPEDISKLFGASDTISDVEYLGIIYYIVRDLRENMCQKICRSAAAIL